MDFCHLHVHNEYSVLDGLGSAEEYAKKAKALGQTHLALTNHGNIDGCIRFQRACEAEGITPIFGTEAYIVKDPTFHVKQENRSHVLLLAKNETGWTNICKLLTKANLEGHYYRPRISPEWLLQHRDGVVVSTACTSSFIKEPWGISLLERLIESNDVFAEIMPFDWTPQIEMNRLVYDVAKKYGLPLIATNDCHYVDNGDGTLQEVLLAMQSHAKWNDPNRWKFEISGLYLKSRSEMERSFVRQRCFRRSVFEEALNNTVLVSEICSGFKAIPKREVELPTPPIIGDENPTKYLIKLCRQTLSEMSFPSKKIEDLYRDRLESEIDAIVKQKFEVYFLIVWELINWCKSNDIMVGPGRGSSGGSLVCYLLGITEVDPIYHKLIFARFISPARIDLPDIDMDFEDTKRDLVRKHLEETYGVWNVAGVSTYSTMKGKGALRDVCRVFDVPLFEVNKAAACIETKLAGEERSDCTIDDSFDASEEGKAFRDKYPKETKFASMLEGQIKTKGQHAAAMVICREDLREGKRCNLLLAKDEKTVVNWDKYDVEHAGIMKLDVLGLNALSILSHAKKLVKQNHGVDIIYPDIPISGEDSEECYRNFTAGNNAGCFQVGSPGIQKLCTQLGIENFDMLVHATSLYRPGTLRSGMVDEFIKRKHGEKQWSNPSKLLDDITRDTFGIILYQEQVMRLIYEIAGLDWKMADTIRKVIGKSKGAEEFLKYESMFVEGCVKSGNLDSDTAKSIWKDLASFGAYGFNLSHAVEYSYITYWDMWVKLHYPEEFIASWLTFGQEDKKEEIIAEAYRIGMSVKLPKIQYSRAKDWYVANKSLYMPFISIKGIGEASAAQCEAIKNNKGFFNKKEKGIGTKTAKLLESIGAFDENKEFSDKEIEALSPLFSVPLMRDPSKRFDKILELLSHKIEIVNDPNLDDYESKSIFVFGRVVEFVNMCCSLESGQCVVFDSRIFHKKKQEIELCVNKYALIYGEVAGNHINCSDIWFEEDILSGNLEGVPLSLRKREIPADWLGLTDSLKECQGCNLRSECKAPVVYSRGRINAMIVGEAPGMDEDSQGKGFVGKSGTLLWSELGIDRRTFHVTNVVKCYPSKTRTPTKANVLECSKHWLNEEIDMIKPFVILALGNTSLLYFKGKESGIMSANATTEWNEKAGAWVCYCIHPATVLYHRDNFEMFRAGIENFRKKFMILGR